MDKIILEDAKYDANIGLSPEERDQKQTIHVDLTIYYDSKPSAKSDDIKDTINYAEINTDIQEIFNNYNFVLLEYAAEKITSIILSKYNIQKIKIKIKKKAILENVSFSCVQITRKK